MSRIFITDSQGNNVTTDRGNPLIYSNSDGDNSNRQTVYEVHDHGADKLDVKYNPSTGKFSK